jgi:hypothetical protein
MMNKEPAIWNGIDSLPQTFDPADGPPRMLECMVPFYEMFIPLCCKGDPVKLKAAYAALAQRNTFLVEDIINPRPGVSRIEAMRRLMAKVRKARGLPPWAELTEEEDEALLRALGYDV